MDEKYIIELKNNSNLHFVVITVNDCTVDFHINFLDFKDEDVSLNGISQFDLIPPKNVFPIQITESIYQEINQRAKIKAKINNTFGVFYRKNDGYFLWEEKPVQDGLSLVESFVIKRRDEKSAHVKVLLNYDKMKVWIKDSPTFESKKQNASEVVIFSSGSPIRIKCQWVSKNIEEIYEIPVREFDRVDSVKIFSDVSKYKIERPTKPSNNEAEVRLQQNQPKEEKTRVNKGDDRHLNEKISQQSREISTKEEQIKSLEGEIRKLQNDNKKLESLNDDSNKRLTSAIKELNNFAEKYKNVEILEATIAELKPYQEFFNKHAGNTSIEKLNSDLAEFVKLKSVIENLVKNNENPQMLKDSEIFKAFVELNKILLFDSNANNSIFYSISEHDQRFNESFKQFVEMLHRLNALVVRDCREKEINSIEMIPASVLTELGQPENYKAVVELQEAFWKLPIKFVQIKEVNRDVFLSVLENLRKLVNINRGK